jgi:DNA-binding NtrC family response regulator
MVDDEPNVLAAHFRMLGRHFDLTTAQSGLEALRLIESDGPFAVVVTDMSMPGMSGVDLAAAAQNTAPDTVFVILTGNLEQHIVVEAINRGHVFRFHNKPCPPAQLEQTIRDGIRQHELAAA